MDERSVRGLRTQPLLVCSSHVAEPTLHGKVNIAASEMISDGIENWSLPVGRPNVWCVPRCVAHVYAPDIGSTSSHFREFRLFCDSRDFFLSPFLFSSQFHGYSSANFDPPRLFHLVTDSLGYAPPYASIFENRLEPRGGARFRFLVGFDSVARSAFEFVRCC